MNKLYPLIIFLFFATFVSADTIRGTLPAETDGIVSISANTKNTTVISERTKFKLKYGTKRQRLALLKNNTLYPVLLGIKLRKKFYTVKQAMDNDICSNENAVGLNTIATGIKKAKFAFGQVDEVDAYAYLKSFAYKEFANTRKKALKTIVASKYTTEIDDDCAPAGNALSSGLTSTGGISSLAVSKPGDLDNDGIPDIFDIDRDGDGILNPYDPDTRLIRKSFYVFSNLKAPIENTLNSNTGITPTDSQIDALLSSTNGLAIEVKADDDRGQTSELNCGSLSYCSTGGTGTIANTTDAFPGSLGGTYDSDSDGMGTIEEGDTGDFQLKTGANSSEVNAGDFFVQIVNRPSKRALRFFKRLDFVFKGTPAIKSIVRNPGTATESTYNYSFPISDGDPGTSPNCLSVSEDPDTSSLVLELEAWRPQRKGIPAAGEADFVDIGNSDITIDIPNTPCATSTSGGCTGTRTTNNCSVSSYSESDTNLEIDGDNLRDTRADADADSTATVKFKVDLKACLAETGDTLDVNQKVFLGVQFRSQGVEDEGRDNAAVRFCVKRTS